jgi:hypothetical protein
MVMPLQMRLTYGDGTSEMVSLPVDMWNLGGKFTYHVKSGRPVVRVEVDPRGSLPDINRANNSWGH